MDSNVRTQPWKLINSSRLFTISTNEIPNSM